MKSIEWIDRLIAERKLPSDRQAALLLGMTASAMSGHRGGRLVTLDDKYAYRLEELLNLPHGKIVLDQHAEREKDPNVSAMWRKLASGVALLVALLVGIGAPNDAVANNYKKSTQVFDNPRIINIGDMAGVQTARL